MRRLVETELASSNPSHTLGRPGQGMALEVEEG